MRKHKDVEWTMPERMSDGTWEQVGIIVLMDIRDELKRLNTLLCCPNFTRILATLDAIKTNTKKRQKKTVKGRLA